MPPIFTPPILFAGTWQDAALFALLALLTATVWRLRQQTRGHDPKVYNVYHAWLRGLLYFCGSTLVSLLTGVLARVVMHPLATPAQLTDVSWWALTVGCLLVEVVAYFGIWRAGTLAHGRALHLPSVLVFGLLWGLSEAQVFLSFWAIVEGFGGPRWLTALIAFALISTFKGLWQSQYWDIYVSPEHNIPAWNFRKVLFAHIPNLIFTLTYLAVYESAGMFIGLQCVALLGSAYFMHFPAWTEIKSAPTGLKKA